VKPTKKSSKDRGETIALIAGFSGADIGNLLGGWGD
jgi:hypothetical protein